MIFYAITITASAAIFLLRTVKPSFWCTIYGRSSPIDAAATAAGAIESLGRGRMGGEIKQLSRHYFKRERDITRLIDSLVSHLTIANNSLVQFLRTLYHFFHLCQTGLLPAEYYRFHHIIWSQGKHTLS